MSDLDFEQVDFVTVGTIGAPGQRVFHLQAGQGERLLTFTLEKEQAAAITSSVRTVLAEIEKELQRPTPAPVLASMDLDLREPILPTFRVAQIGLGYDQDLDLMVLVLTELLPSDHPEEPRAVRISASRAQMAALADHTRIVVAGGRATPQSNGHFSHRDE